MTRNDSKYSQLTKWWHNTFVWLEFVRLHLTLDQHKVTATYDDDGFRVLFLQMHLHRRRGATEQLQFPVAQGASETNQISDEKYSTEGFYTKSRSFWFSSTQPNH